WRREYPGAPTNRRWWSANITNEMGQVDPQIDFYAPTEREAMSLAVREARERGLIDGEPPRGEGLPSEQLAQAQDDVWSWVEAPRDADGNVYSEAPQKLTGRHIRSGAWDGRSITRVKGFDEEIYRIQSEIGPYAFRMVRDKRGNIKGVTPLVEADLEEGLVTEMEIEGGKGTMSLGDYGNDIYRLENRSRIESEASAPEPQPEGAPEPEPEPDVAPEPQPQPEQPAPTNKVAAKARRARQRKEGTAPEREVSPQEELEGRVQCSLEQGEVAAALDYPGILERQPGQLSAPLRRARRALENDDLATAREAFARRNDPEPPIEDKVVEIAEKTQRATAGEIQPADEVSPSDMQPEPMAARRARSEA